jgi:hypothetical protein
MAPENTEPSLKADLSHLPPDLVAEAERIAKEYEEGRVTPRPKFISRPRLSYEEFRKLLDEMAALGMGDAPPLPADWSRADLYGDHD